MPAGYGCGPEDEIRETERLASEQDRREERDREDDDQDWAGASALPDGDPTEAELEPEPRDYQRLIAEGTYTDADAHAAQLQTIPHELIQLAMSPEVLPPAMRSTHPRDVQEHLYYNPQEGDALEVVTVPVNKYGDRARPGDTTVAFKITFEDFSIEPEIAAIIVCPSSTEQVQVLHDIAWALASGRGRKASDAQSMIDTLSKAAELMGVKVSGLLLDFPLNNDSRYERAVGTYG